MKPESLALWQARKVKSTPRKDRPRCGAKTRKGTPCKAQSLANGRCKYHGGLSTGPRGPVVAAEPLAHHPEHNADHEAGTSSTRCSR